MKCKEKLINESVKCEMRAVCVLASQQLFLCSLLAGFDQSESVPLEFNRL